jgi:endonuclease/exonuclease/phosphatase family metal-dependent hydrolase
MIHETVYECYTILTGNTMVGGLLHKVIITAGAITFYLRVHCDHFPADSVRAYVFQQLLCRTYALTPSGSKVVVHGDFNPQYQIVLEKILIGTDLN